MAAAAAQTKIITELNVAQLQALQAALHPNAVLILKFGADWCGPCKAISPAYQAFIQHCPANILCADIDVDESLDLYMALKKVKMVSGIPVFLAFFGGVKRESWFIPDDSIIGANPVEVNDFFKRCLAKAGGEAAYTYFT
jgi:thiol-disulfide isomerase/thioredoxin